MSNLAFASFSLHGVDAQKFLQGQVTINVEALSENTTRYAAICDLKGRIHFGLWLNKQSSESFQIVTTQDQSEEFAKHIRKYGAFSKMKLEDAGLYFHHWLRKAVNFPVQNQILTLGNYMPSKPVRLGLLIALSMSFSRRNYAYINVKAFTMTKGAI